MRSTLRPLPSALRPLFSSRNNKHDKNQPPFRACPDFQEPGYADFGATNKLKAVPLSRFATKSMLLIVCKDI